MRKRFAVIPTGNRPEEYARVISWCRRNNTHPITIATTKFARSYAVGTVINDSGQLNISRWWNRGIEMAWDYGADLVAVLNDDALPDDFWWDSIERNIGNNSGASGMNHNKAIMGWAFVLQDKTIRCDESIKWYFTDDVVQIRCKNANGFKLIKNLEVKNTRARESEDSFVRQIERDRQEFLKNYA